MGVLTSASMGRLAGPLSISGAGRPPEVEPRREDVALAVSAKTAPPRAAVLVAFAKTLQIAATTKPPTAFVLLAQIFPGTVSAKTQAPRASVYVAELRVIAVNCKTRRPKAIATLAYDPNLLSDVVHLAGENWSTALLGAGAAKITLPPGVRLSKGVLAPVQEGQNAGYGSLSRWRELPTGLTGGEVSWGLSQGLRAGPVTPWDSALLYLTSANEPWQEGPRKAGCWPKVSGTRTRRTTFSGRVVRMVRLISRATPSSGYPPHRLACRLPGRVFLGEAVRPWRLPDLRLEGGPARPP